MAEALSKLRVELDSLHKLDMEKASENLKKSYQHMIEEKDKVKWAIRVFVCPSIYFFLTIQILKTRASKKLWQTYPPKPPVIMHR